MSKNASLATINVVADSSVKLKSIKVFCLNNIDEPYNFITIKFTFHTVHCTVYILYIVCSLDTLFVNNNSLTQWHNLHC